VSANAAGTGTGNRSSYTPAISADGSVVVFSSSATDLITLSETNSTWDVFARNLETGTTQLVSINSTGNGSGNRGSGNVVPNASLAISADGNMVAFQSFASDLTALSDANNRLDVFTRNLQTGATHLISVNSAGNGSGGGDPSFGGPSVALAISADGCVVAFSSSASDLIDSDFNSKLDVFVSTIEWQDPLGDYNCGAAVDAADYVVWRKLLGTTGVAVYSGADGDGDTTIDVDDYDVWYENFGAELSNSGTGGLEVELGGYQSLEHADAVAVSATASRAGETRTNVVLNSQMSRSSDAKKSTGRPVQKLAPSRGDALAKLLLSHVFDRTHEFSAGDIGLSLVERSESDDDLSIDTVDSVFHEFRSTYRNAFL
jgi:hypothetical protein